MLAAPPSRPMRDDPPLVLHTDCFECDSRGSAHDLLIRLLGEFQLPGMTLKERSSSGDVYFSGPGDGVVSFARANLVFLLRQTGATLSELSPIATCLDRRIVLEPSTSTPLPGAPATPSTRSTRSPRSTRGARASATKVKVGDAVSLSSSAAPGTRSRAGALKASFAPPPEGPRVMRKVFSRLGDVSSDGEVLIYHPDTPGLDDVAVYSIDPTGSVALERRSYLVE